VLKYLQSFPEAIFLVVPMESIFVEEEVLSRQTRIIAEKDHNFWFDRWITLKYLLKFQEPRSLVLPIESLLVELEVWSC